MADIPVAGEQMKGIFLSYRRTDSAADTGRLYSALKNSFDERTLFFDTITVEPGAEWPARIQNAVRAAGIVLIVMGPDWIRTADQFGLRAIDRPDDWSRREIEIALLLNKPVIPLLVRGAVQPPADRLPTSIAALAQRQSIELRNDYFDHDVQLVVSQIRALQAEGPTPAGSDPYPAPPPEKPDGLSEEKLRVALEGSLREWRKIVTPLPEDPEKTRVELYREFHFLSFRDAISFMNEVAPGCDIALHHPRWENIWRTLRVFLTTWDIGHQISDRDIQLAKYFDKAYSEFGGAKTF